MRASKLGTFIAGIAVFSASTFTPFMMGTAHADSSPSSTGQAIIKSITFQNTAPKMVQHITTVPSGAATGIAVSITNSTSSTVILKYALVPIDSKGELDMKHVTNTQWVFPPDGHEYPLYGKAKGKLSWVMVVTGSSIVPNVAPVQKTSATTKPAARTVSKITPAKKKATKNGSSQYRRR